MTRQARNYIATVLYADIFDYPLTVKELHRWMIGDASSKNARNAPVERHKIKGKTYIVAKKRKHIIARRKECMVHAPKKWSAARRVIRLFAWIPTVHLIGVTGGLAVGNASIEDDIDVFIVTSSRALWATRCMVTIMSDIVGIRRRPKETSVANKICLNMFMTQDALALPRADRDLFAAHEVLQMVPMWERFGTYRRFLSSNRWVREFLPNAWKQASVEAQKHGKLQINSIQNLFFSLPFVFVEPIAKKLQLWYMRRHRTTETIQPSVLRFHPRDARIWIKRRYRSRLKQYNIPLDNIFYRR